ncbi:uncharacterized protein VNE69_12165 [Vairimorpha necatrix]|uniref:Uncharacterized protein n=1 Tax=Vairimorpha necatrix TaxID=6039 RepID=A0AAX4JHJ5_9MICR
MVAIKYLCELLLNHPDTYYYYINALIQPQDIVIYNPKHHDAIDLFFIEFDESILIIKRGFELVKTVERINLSFSSLLSIIEKVLTNILDRDYIRYSRVLVVFDDTKSEKLREAGFLISLFKMIPFLDSVIIQETFDEKCDWTTSHKKYKITDLSLGLCLLHFINFAYILDQKSTITGTIRFADDAVLGVRGFKNFISANRSIHEYVKWLRKLFAEDSENYVLFGKDGTKFHDLLWQLQENKSISDDFFIEIVQLLYHMETSSFCYKKVDLEYLDTIQVTDNKKLIEYIKTGKVDEKVSTFTKKYSRVRFPDLKTEDGLYDGEPKSYAMSLKKYKNLLQNISAKAFYAMEGCLLMKIFNNYENYEKRREDFRSIFNADGPEKYLMYGHLVNDSVIPCFEDYRSPRHQLISDPCYYPKNASRPRSSKKYTSNSRIPNDNVLGDYKMDIDWYIENFLFIFMYFKYEGFYALTVLFAFNIIDMPYDDIKSKFTHYFDENVITHFSRLEPLRKNKALYKNQDGVLSNVYTSKDYQKVIEYFCNKVKEDWMTYGGLDKQICSHFYNETFCSKTISDTKTKTGSLVETSKGRVVNITTPNHYTFELLARANVKIPYSTIGTSE